MEDDDAAMQQRHSLAWWLDSSIPLPGGFRIGLDGLIGLIPGIGDAVGGGLSTWMLYQAYKLNVPKVIMARMIINVLLDALLGSIPLIGDIFDFFWKANLRNAQLLDRYQQSPRRTYRKSVASTALFFVGLFALGFLIIFGVVSLAALLWTRLNQGA